MGESAFSWSRGAGCWVYWQARAVRIAVALMSCALAAAAVAERALGTAAAVKLAAPVHKTEIEGVRLGIETPDAAADAVRDITVALRDL